MYKLIQYSAFIVNFDAYCIHVYMHMHIVVQFSGSVTFDTPDIIQFVSTVMIFTRSLSPLVRDLTTGL